jgi:hypothetical protein
MILSRHDSVASLFPHVPRPFSCGWPRWEIRGSILLGCRFSTLRFEPFCGKSPQVPVHK